MTDIITFPAALTDRQVKEGEEIHQSWQPIRRAALVVLSRDSSFLSDGVKNDDTAETLLSLAEDIGDFLTWRENETKLLTAAHARLLAVLEQKCASNEADGGMVA